MIQEITEQKQSELKLREQRGAMETLLKRQVAAQTASAIAHVHTGLTYEPEPYRRGQLLLWGARAAIDPDPAQAARWRDELMRLSGDGVEELQIAARRRRRGAPHVNLMMVDAY